MWIVLYFRHGQLCKYCGLTLDIPYEFGDTNKYQATLAHKLNNKFEPNSGFRAIETARYISQYS